MIVSVLAQFLEVLRYPAVVCREIEGKKCFVVGFDTFHSAYEKFSQHEDLFSSPVLVKAGFQNFEIRTVPDEIYYICLATEPVLDKLWKEKYKAPTEEKR